MTNKYGIIILAAGSSSRLGRPKQLLHYKAQSFLQNIVGIALEVAVGPVIIVLGSQADLLRKELDETKIITVINEDWQDGIGSSIGCGLKKLTDHIPSAEGVIFTVCDQPFVTTSLLYDLVDAYHRTHQPIIASAYDNTIGIPAFFHRDIFPQLLQLKADKGAKQLMNSYKDQMTLVSFPMGSRDIDTEADYEQLLQNKNNNDR